MQAHDLAAEAGVRSLRLVLRPGESTVHSLTSQPHRARDVLPGSPVRAGILHGRLDHDLAESPDVGYSAKNGQCRFRVLQAPEGVLESPHGLPTRARERNPYTLLRIP